MLEKLAQPETLADRAYREIKQAIIQGDFLPGDLLPEETIASQLGVSRTPLRKAISRLEYEGLVELERGKVARVAVYTQQDLDNFFSLRELLEIFAIENAVLYATEDVVKELEDLMIEQKKAIDEMNWYDYILIDCQFHVSIAKITGNSKLMEFVEQINNHLHRYLILSRTLEQSANNAYLEHLEIIQAFKEKSVEKASDIMKKHVKNVKKRAENQEKGM